MAIRQIRKEGDEILKKKSREVDEINEKIQELIDDMLDTMYAANGVGLAAVQVGVLKQVIVIETEDDPLYVLINPEIISSSGKQLVDEGCLSFPNKFGKIERPEKVKVRALNEDGKKIEIKATGLLAQAICHEIDHLNGEVFIDKIIPGSLEIIKPEKK